MYRRWISMLLSALTLLGISGPAFAEGEAGPPPVEDVVTEGMSEADIAIPDPAAECGEPDAELPETETVSEDGDIAAASYEAETKNADLPTGGVTVTITGELDTLRSLNFFAPGGEKYDNLYLYQPQKGLCRFDLWDDQGNGEYVQVGNSLPGQFSVYPGTDIAIQTKPEYDVTVSAGEIIRDTFFLDTLADGACGVGERLVNIMPPDSGSMTVTIAPASKALPYEVPMTMYGGPLQGDGFLSANVGDETSFGHWSYFEPDEYGTERGTIYTGTKLCFQLQSGYTIQVIKGGKVVRVGSYCYPTNITDCVGVDIQVDENATEFVYAILKQGETFDPNNYTTPVDMNKFLDDSADTSDEPFQDVPPDSWYAGDVERAYALGVIQDTEDHVFRPNAAITRGQTVTILYRAEGSPEGGSGAFSDISDAETSSAASWAAAQGIVKGVGGGAFDPGSSLTREQFVTVLYRLAGSPDAGGDVLGQFKDGGQTSSYAVPAMNWALNNGVLSGYGDGIIQPRGVATRAEVCALVMRFTGA